MKSQFYEQDHEDYRAVVREYIRRSVAPHHAQWEQDRLVDRAAWTGAGDVGLLGLAAPREFGGSDIDDFRYRMVACEEVARAAVTSFGGGISVQDDIIIPYVMSLATQEQKQRWLTGLVSGELIGAIAMTEPGTGSDLQGIRTRAVPDGEGWRISGQKTFISSGILSDMVIVVARTDPDAGSRGFTLFVVERGQEGFERGRKLDKIGMPAQDTAELFFDDAHVGPDHVLGEVGQGFFHLMQHLPRERMSIAAGAITAAQAALDWTLTYVYDRRAFGQRIGDFQNTRFVLAELETAVDVARAYTEQAVLALNAGELTAVEAAKAKWWTSELQVSVTTRCLQLFGGYGFMNEYPIGRAFRDSRIQTIYGGTTEIMKEIIGRDQAKRFPE